MNRDRAIDYHQTQQEEVLVARGHVPWAIFAIAGIVNIMMLFIAMLVVDCVQYC